LLLALAGRGATLEIQGPTVQTADLTQSLLLVVVVVAVLMTTVSQVVQAVGLALHPLTELVDLA
jgi:hypothetical protein